MKKFVTPTVIFVLVLALLVSLFYIYKSKKEVSNIDKVLNTIPDSTHFYKDKYNKEHAYSESIQLTSGEAQILYKKKLDSISKELKIKPSDIKVIIEDKTKTVVNVVPQKTDTIYKTVDGIKQISSLTGIFKDNWFDADVTLGDNKSLKFLLTDTAQAVLHKTPGLFNKRNLLDIKHSSPYTQSSNVSSILIQDANSSISVSIFVGYGYQIGGNAKPQPIFGIGVSKRIFSIGK